MVGLRVVSYIMFFAGTFLSQIVPVNDVELGICGKWLMSGFLI